MWVVTLSNNSIFRRFVPRARRASPRFRLSMLMTVSTWARWPYGRPAWLPASSALICRRYRPAAGRAEGRPADALRNGKGTQSDDPAAAANGRLCPRPAHAVHYRPRDLCQPNHDPLPADRSAAGFHVHGHARPTAGGVPTPRLARARRPPATWACDEPFGDPAAATDTHDALNQVIQDVGAVTLAGGIAVDAATLLTEESCAAFAQFAAAKLVSLAAAQVVNTVVAQNLSYMAQLFGVSESQMRIGADAVQLFFLFKAARAERQQQAANCFAGDTLVQTGDHGEQPIDALTDGERVVTSVSETAADGGPAASVFGDTAVDPATWREVTLTMADPATPGDDYDKRRLEPLSWIAANGAAAGTTVDLDLPELEVSGPAQVVSIGACPAIGAGERGRSLI